MKAPVEGCVCRACVHERDQLAAPWLKVEKTLTYRCPDCGSERCPRAYSHERACTGQAGRTGA